MSTQMEAMNEYLDFYEDEIRESGATRQEIIDRACYPGIYADFEECMSEPEDDMASKSAEADRKRRVQDRLDENVAGYIQYIVENDVPEWDEIQAELRIAERYRLSKHDDDSEVEEAPSVGEESIQEQSYEEERRMIGVFSRRYKRYLPPAVASYLSDNEDDDIDVDAIVEEYYRNHPQDGFIDSEDEEISQEIQDEIAAENRRQKEQAEQWIQRLVSGCPIVQNPQPSDPLAYALWQHNQEKEAKKRQNGMTHLERWTSEVEKQSQVIKSLLRNRQ